PEGTTTIRVRTRTATTEAMESTGAAATDAPTALSSARLHHAERVRRHEPLLEERRPLLWRDEPVGRTHGQDLDQREALALELRLDRVAQVLRRETDRGRRVHRRTRDVGGAVELRHELRDPDRAPVPVAIAAADRRLRVLAQHRGRRHVATGLTEDGVVEDD